jgi:hypothetical protein
VQLGVCSGEVPAATVNFKGDVINRVSSRCVFRPAIEKVETGWFVRKEEDDAATLRDNEGAKPENLPSLPVRLKEDEAERSLRATVLRDGAERTLKDKRLIGTGVWLPECERPIDIQEWQVSSMPLLGLAPTLEDY